MSASTDLDPARAPAGEWQPGPTEADHRATVDPVPLPSIRWSERAHRRRAQRLRKRRRRIRRIGLAPAVAVVLVAVSVVLARPADQDEAVPPDPAPAPPPGPAVPPVLLAHQDSSGRASSLTALVPAANGKGGAVVLIPPGTMTEVVSLGLEPVGQSLDLGGPERLRATVENMFGATLAGVVVFDDAGAARLVSPVGPLTVEVPERVEQVSPGGAVEVVHEPGPARLAPTATGRFLAAKGRLNDLSRLARHQAFWEAWLAALRERPSAVPAQPPELAAALRALVAGHVVTRVVPVEAFGGTTQGNELYKVRGDELDRMVATVFPNAARRGASERPRVQILNGTGALGLADAVRNRLGPGYDVRLTANAARFDHARTEVIFYDRAEQVAADRVRQALGVGTLVLSPRPLDVVDVTVLVGKDFRP